MRTWVHRLLVSALAVSFAASHVFIAHRAEAQSTPAAHGDPALEARRYFSEGSAHYLAKHYAEALEALRISHRLVPSPNSGLLIARSLRELKRPAEALEMYGLVIDASSADAKYTQTAGVAAAEAAALRASMGAIRIRVLHPLPGTLLEVDDVAVPISPDKEAVLWHAPGAATVKFRPPTGVEQTQVVSVAAGGELRMEFQVAVAPLPRPDDRPFAPPSPRPPSWAIPAAWISGGVAIVGAGAFVGFGLRSQAIYRDLTSRCGPAACGPRSVPAPARSPLWNNP